MTSPIPASGPCARYTVVPHPARHFEDCVAGERFPCGGFTLSEEEIVAFARAYDPQVFHVDPERARTALSGGLIASAVHTFAATVAIFTRATGGLDLAIGLSLRQIDLPAPLRPEMPITVTGTFVATRISASRPGIGLVTWEAESRDREGGLVLRCGSTIMVRCRPSGETLRRP